MRQGGHVIDGLKEKEGLLIPKVGEHDTVDSDTIQWILVIEKEVRNAQQKNQKLSLTRQATFRSLLSTTLWESLGSHGLVLTVRISCLKLMGHRSYPPGKRVP